MQKLTEFTFEGITQEVRFRESETLTGGTRVDIYDFVGDGTKDLAVFETRKTPLQKVLNGDRTVEGYISGEGNLTILHPNGTQSTYYVGGKNQQALEVDVAIGDTMQWEAYENSIIRGYEVCFPPWQPGRYEELEY